MKVISWNINGLANAFKKGHLEEMILRERPDILCLQEVRCSTPQPIPGFKHTIFHCASRKGYSGTSISSNELPINIFYGFEKLGKDFKDTEGRVIAFEFKKCIIVSVYVPNSKADLSRLNDRCNWDAKFSELLKVLELIKPVIVCGDFNVAHNEIDIHNPVGKSKQHGFTPQERAGFNILINSNELIDTFRFMHPDIKKFSWWSNFAKSRERNAGWRIDYILVSKHIKNMVKHADIITDQRGSDHAPLVVELNL